MKQFIKKNKILLVMFFLSLIMLILAVLHSAGVISFGDNPPSRQEHESELQLLYEENKQMEEKLKEAEASSLIVYNPS